MAYCAIGIDESNTARSYFLSPGNLLTRTINFPDFLSHILEPFYIILFVLCEFLSNKNNSTYRLPAKILFLSAWLLEIFHFYQHVAIPGLIIQGLWAGSFILYSFAILSGVKTKIANSKLDLIPIFLVVLGVITPFIQQNESPQIKATHYYLWFPDNWKAGYGTGELVDQPLRGHYVSSDKNTVRGHLKEISDQGIRLVILDWWPLNPVLKKRALNVVNVLKEFPELKFSLHLETLQLGLDKNSGLMTMDEARTYSLKRSFELLGLKLFNNQQYFRINNQPTIFMYASRHLIGDVNKSLSVVRKYTEEKTGFQPYIIGDEAFFQVPEGRNSEHARLLPRFIPAWERLKAFDAITLYNPYDPTHHYESLKTNDTSDFLIESATLYDHYKNISDHLGIPFFPTVIPSYNDKAIRPHLNHQIVPRIDSNSISTLDALLKITDQYKNNRHGPDIVIITSFNEWNEGTNIEQ